MFLRLVLILIFSGWFSFLSGQTDTNHVIQVHFLYGSKPLRKFKGTEQKLFGGLHGGHVSFEVDSIDYGFGPEGRFHFFSHKNNCHSLFRVLKTHGLPVYPKGTKVVTFYIPISNEGYNKLISIVSDYCSSTPYDYAFIGMRCAAAAQDVLSQIGVVEPRSRFVNIFTTFYPKKLRKRMFKLAEKKHYKIEKQEGRKSRKWEKD
jgi:hypothetical protein